MGSIANNIQAVARSLMDILYEKKYHVDYFQRAYKWQTKHVEQLLVDLEASFLANYSPEHERKDVADYNCYYLGPIVISERSAGRSIVDGQQRLTTMTLLLIFLNTYQHELGAAEPLDALIYSTKFGKKSYNIEVPDRTKVLDSLFLNTRIEEEDLLDESVQNMLDRYMEISALFPDSLKGKTALMFIDWLKEKVVFVEILAYSDENAYTIFETMNDRGLNLTPTEMLKGYLLTNVQDEKKIKELNDLWKMTISKMHSISTQEDLEFFRAWLRGQYADTLRSKTKGSGNEDFEKIGTKFHTWVKDNSRKIGLKTSDAFYFFIKSDMQFYSTVYLRILEGMNGNVKQLENLYLSSHWSIAASLSLPLMMAPISKMDDEAIINEKLNIVSRFIDIYTAYRYFSGSSITQSAIRHSMFMLVKEIRNKSVDDLSDILRHELLKMDENLSNLNRFDIYSVNYQFIRYVFARIVYHLETIYLHNDVIFQDLIVTRKKNRYTVVPLISPDHFESYSNYFENEAAYSAAYVQLGNYVYVPNPISQPMEDMIDERKLTYLEHQNYFSASVRKTLNSSVDERFGLIAVEKFSSETIAQRTASIVALIKEIWNPDSLLMRDSEKAGHVLKKEGR